MLNTSLAPGAGRILTGTALALLLAFSIGTAWAETPAVSTAAESDSSSLSSTEGALPSAPMARLWPHAKKDKDADTDAPKGLLAQHLALEAGGGMNYPRSAISGYNTTGYNGILGAGWMFTHQFGTLLEYQFVDDSLTNYELTALSQGSCYPQGTICASGHGYTNFLSVAPLLYFVDDTKFNAYVTLGVGMARKATDYSVTSVPYSIVNQQDDGTGATTSSSYSAWRLGYDFGIGLTYKTGWAKHVKYFADIRYMKVDTTQPFGLNANAVGRTVLAPFEVGLRY